MRIWLVKDGETLPIQPEAKRMRVWRLAEALVARGHQVIWWASTFAHLRKEILFDEDQRIDLSSRFTLRLISAGRYKKNISLARYKHHKTLARRFLELAQDEVPPDIIVSSLPINDLAYNSVKFGRMISAKSIIDIRDPWPDVFVDKAPELIKPIVPFALKRAYAKTAWLLSNADAWVTVSRGFAKWAVQRSGGVNRPTRVFYIGGKASPPGGDTLQGTQLLTKLAGRPLYGKVLCVFVGQFTHSYDLETVVSAARMSKEEGLKNLHFLICGDGEKFDKISEMAYGLDNVTLPGWVLPNDVIEILNHSHIGIVPCRSYPNTVPNKVFEYMAVGLPILSSLEGELVGLLRENGVGYSYKTGDSRTLFRHLKALCKDKGLRESLATNSARLFAKSFSADRVDEEYADFVEAVGTHETREQKY